MISKKKKIPSPLLLPLHAFASFSMTGIMLFMHFVHYPLFKFVEPDKFIAFHNSHIAFIMPIIGFLMIIELLTALGLFLRQTNWLWILNFLLVVGTWLATGFWQGPMHMQLGRSYDPALIDKLIRTDIWRVLLWIHHSALVLYALVISLRVKTQQKS